MRLLNFSLPLLLTYTLIASVSAQDKTLVTPQPEHKLLQRLAGDWEFERWSIPAEGAVPDILGSGTVTAEMVGAFFVVSRWTGKIASI